MLCAIFIVAILVLLSNGVTKKRNGFNRNFFNDKVSVIATLDLNTPVRSICNLSGNNLYFETNNPSKLLRTDSDLKHQSFINLPVSPNDRIISLFTTFVDSPDVYIMAGNVPAIIQVNLDSDSVFTKMFPSKTFTRSVVVGKNTYVFRAYKNISQKWEQIFIKGNLATNKITEEKDVSEKRGDAGFSTDGLLHYDASSNKLLYVFYYKSEFICMDTNLNLIYKAHTIDTLNSYQTKGGSVTSQGSTTITNTAPIKDVNSQSCVEGGKLFIVSKLVADNENKTTFKNNSAIDVYSIQNRSYDGSFYVPFYKTEELQDFKIYHNQIVVLYKTHIVIYKLPF